MRLTPLGPDAVVCELELLGVHKSAVARSFDGRIDMQRVCGWAFGCAAALFGLLPPRSEGAWVDFDLDGGEPVLLPGDGVDDAGPLTHDDGAPADGVPADGAPGDDPPGAFEDGAPVLLETPAGAGVAEASAGEAAPPEAAGEVRSPGQQAIERLVDRLRAEGLGRQAAGLVVAHGGYGRSPEDARSLYRELRELLLEKGAVS